MVYLAATAVAAPLSDKVQGAGGRFAGGVSSGGMERRWVAGSCWPPHGDSTIIYPTSIHTFSSPYSQFGRRPLLLLSFAGMATCLFAVAIITFFQVSCREGNYSVVSSCRRGAIGVGRMHCIRQLWSQT